MEFFDVVLMFKKLDILSLNFTTNFEFVWKKSWELLLFEKKSTELPEIQIPTMCRLKGVRKEV